jgi:hypothetical protein
VGIGRVTLDREGTTNLKGASIVSTATDSLEIVERSFTVDDIETLSVTLNIRRDGLECLTNEDTGTTFRSKDKPSNDETEEQVQRQITAVYDTIGRTPSGEMTSLAARFSGIFRSDNKLLTGYGDIVLLMDWAEIAPHIVIFNGDAKNLGSKLLEAGSSGSERSDWLRSFSFQDHDLDSQIASTALKLQELRAKSMGVHAMPPRIVGQYCEARLFRELLPTDVAKAFIPEVAHSEMSLIQELKRIKASMRTSQ